MKKYSEMEIVVDVTSVTPRGQTTIPQDIRKLLNIKPGDKVLWSIIQEKKKTYVTIKRVV